MRHEIKTCWDRSLVHCWCCFTSDQRLFLQCPHQNPFIVIRDWWDLVSKLLGLVAVVVSWAFLLWSDLFRCNTAFPSVVARFTAVVAVTSAADLFVFSACVLRCFGECAVFRLKMSGLSAWWLLSRLPLAAFATVVARLLLLLVGTTAVPWISVADVTRVYPISRCSRPRKILLSHTSRCFSKPRVLSCFSKCLGWIKHYAYARLLIAQTTSENVNHDVI